MRYRIFELDVAFSFNRNLVLWKQSKICFDLIFNVVLLRNVFRQFTQ
jgi:hypothetical protein